MNALSTATGELSGPVRAFFDFWSSLPKTNLLPRLSDFFDRVPPALAPHIAVIDVRGPEDALMRLFGTRLVEQAAFDPTGRPVAELYASHLRPRVHRVLWEATRRPVGYIALRTIFGRGGAADTHPGIGLPIDIPTSGIRGVVNYSYSAIVADGVFEERAHLVQELKLERWVDIGAGVPR